MANLLSAQNRASHPARLHAIEAIMSASLRPLPRRQFLAQTFAAAAALTIGARAENKARTPLPIIGFTKPFQNIGYERTAEVVAEIGWSGIECPVRKKGQVEPERVEDDLPKLHEELKKHGLDLGIITTDIRRVDPLAERVLRTASKLGVKHYRITFIRYDLAKPIPPQLDALRAELRDLAQLSKELGMRGGFQNHSGRDYVGTAVWDIYELVKDLEPAQLGSHFDIGHATVEGGTSWPLEAKLMEPFLQCVYVKDFFWERGDKGWAPKWGPLGDGMVRKEFFDWLKTTNFTGPISQHVEYIEGAGPEQMAIMKKDAATLRSWLAA
jgi:sugar phosphate isomerase/epimerase